MRRFGSNDVTARRRPASISRRERYHVLITMTDENVFSLKYVVENWIKIFIAFSLSDGYSFFTESQKRGLDKDDWNLTLRLLSQDRSMRLFFHSYLICSFSYKLIYYLHISRPRIFFT